MNCEWWWMSKMKYSIQKRKRRQLPIASLVFTLKLPNKVKGTERERHSHFQIHNSNWITRSSLLSLDCNYIQLGFKRCNFMMFFALLSKGVQTREDESSDHGMEDWIGRMRLHTHFLWSLLLGKFSSSSSALSHALEKDSKNHANSFSWSGWVPKVRQGKMSVKEGSSSFI